MKTIIKTIFIFLMASLAVFKSYGQFGVGISLTADIAPPEIPAYTQPECPEDGYLWTPGYWAYGDDGYYWVPGVWVAPPQPGYLWTPGYWGYYGGGYGWHPGYWGLHVGFYGGINYGCGYGGVGFVGGEWAGNVFRYNTAVLNVNRTIVRNTYVNNTVINNTYINNRSSFNGRGGIEARATREERQALYENHIAPTSNQLTHEHFAAHDPGQLARNNYGRPATTSMNTINGRRFTQQGRIAGGVANGSLTPRETRNLENRQSNLNQSIRNDRQANGGFLTQSERQNVNQRQNNLSNSIYQDRHNAAVDHYGNQPSGYRQYSQQRLNGNQPARFESRQQQFNQQTPYKRTGNGGWNNVPQQQQHANPPMRSNQIGNGGRMNALQPQPAFRQQNAYSRPMEHGRR